MSGQQGPHSAGQQPVLRNQRDRCATEGQIGQYLRSGALRLVLEAAAHLDLHMSPGCRSVDGINAVRVSIDPQGRGGPFLDHPLGQHIDATGLHNNPGRRSPREQHIGRRHWRRGSPLECEARQMTLAATEAADSRLPSSAWPRSSRNRDS